MLCTENSHGGHFSVYQLSQGGEEGPERSFAFNHLVASASDTL